MTNYAKEAEAEGMSLEDWCEKYSVSLRSASRRKNSSKRYRTAAEAAHAKLRRSQQRHRSAAEQLRADAEERARERGQILPHPRAERDYNAERFREEREGEENPDGFNGRSTAKQREDWRRYSRNRSREAKENQLRIMRECWAKKKLRETGKPILTPEERLAQQRECSKRGNEVLRLLGMGLAPGPRVPFAMHDNRKTDYTACLPYVSQADIKKNPGIDPVKLNELRKRAGRPRKRGTGGLFQQFPAQPVLRAFGGGVNPNPTPTERTRGGYLEKLHSRAASKSVNPQPAVPNQPKKLNPCTKPAPKQTDSHLHSGRRRAKQR